MAAMGADDADRLLSTRAVAEQLAVSQKTVRRWVARGQLSAIKTLGGQYRPSALRRAVELASGAEDAIASRPRSPMAI